MLVNRLSILSGYVQWLLAGMFLLMIIFLRRDQICLVMSHSWMILQERIHIIENHHLINRSDDPLTRF